MAVPPTLTWLGSVGAYFVVAVTMTFILSACSLQPPAKTLVPSVTKSWKTNADAAGGDSVAREVQWWNALGDAMIDSLVVDAEQRSPTIALALARVDEARSGAQSAQAARGVKLNVSSEPKRGNSQSATGVTQTSAAVNLTLGWEIDLFGRLHHNAASAQQRLLARDADAQNARLLLQSQVVDGAINVRACRQREIARREDLRSREESLRLSALRERAGQIAPIETARAESAMLDSATQLSSATSQCATQVASLVALSGWSSTQIDSATAAALAVGRDVGSLAIGPTPADFAADVLAELPQVRTALRNADAAFEDVGAARAATLPSLNVSALLGTSWVRSLSRTIDSDSWSISGSLLGNLFDGGAGAASVAGARARYAQATAQLESALRSAAQDVDNALINADAAEKRAALNVQAKAAARRLLFGSEAAYRAGRMSLFELEDARRSANAAALAEIDSARDQAQAWVQLIKATANNTGLIGPKSAYTKTP